MLLRGGANLSDKINCERIISNDLSFDLIALHRQAQIDFDKIPTETNKSFWQECKNEYLRIKDSDDKNSSIPHYIIGANEWYASYSRGGFSKGFANPSNGRDYYKEGYKNHKKQAESSIYKRIEFICGDYRDILNNIDISANKKILIYCDSPYRNTTGYGINKNFNFEEYYEWLRETSKSYPIFISEQEMPKDFNCIWEKSNIKRTVNVKKHTSAIERLYFIDNRT